MKNNTLKWTIGCLIGAIIILLTYLIAKENEVITITFFDAFSIAATLSSIILSVIAMFYTFLSGRDSQAINDQVKNTITEIDRQVMQMADDMRKNTEMLKLVSDAVRDAENAVFTSSKALDVIRQDSLSDTEKQDAIKNIENTKNSMLMFLDRMKETED